MATANTDILNAAPQGLCAAQGLWQLLHDVPHMHSFIASVKLSIQSWPGKTYADDIKGCTEEPRVYAGQASKAAQCLDKLITDNEIWALQWFILCIVWQLPEAKAQLQSNSPQKVNETFFKDFDSRMKRLVFGDSSSSSTNCVACMPLEITIIMRRYLQDAYLA